MTKRRSKFRQTDETGAPVSSQPHGPMDGTRANNPLHFNAGSKNLHTRTKVSSTLAQAPAGGRMVGEKDVEHAPLRTRPTAHDMRVASNAGRFKGGAIIISLELYASRERPLLPPLLKGAESIHEDDYESSRHA